MNDKGEGRGGEGKGGEKGGKKPFKSTQIGN